MGTGLSRAEVQPAQVEADRVPEPGAVAVSAGHRLEPLFVGVGSGVRWSRIAG